MTQPASTSLLDRLRASVDKVIPASYRETVYRIVAAVVTGLTATGALTVDKAYLWTQLGLATVTLLFALLYAGTALRAAFYAAITAGSAVLLAYGVAKGIDWPIIVGAIGQALGVATAAAKAQTPASTTAASTPLAG